MKGVFVVREFVEITVLFSTRIFFFFSLDHFSILYFALMDSLKIFAKTKRSHLFYVHVIWKTVAGLLLALMVSQNSKVILRTFRGLRGRTTLD